MRPSLLCLPVDKLCITSSMVWTNMYTTCRTSSGRNSLPEWNWADYMRAQIQWKVCKEVTGIMIQDVDQI